MNTYWDCYEFDGFIVGNSNEIAYQSCLAFASDQDFNKGKVLIVSGGDGTGKTHLLGSIYNNIRKDSPKSKVLICSALEREGFFGLPLNDKKSEDIIDYLVDYNVLLIDDAEELFHDAEIFKSVKRIISELYRGGIHIALMINDFNLEDEFSSAFKDFAVEIAEIKTDDFNLNCKIIELKLSELGLMDINQPEAIIFIADFLSDNVRMLESALSRLAFYYVVNTPEDEVVDLKFLKDAFPSLNEQIKAFEKAYKIINTVSIFYDIPVIDMMKRNRNKKLSKASCIAIYLVRMNTDLPFGYIGNIFGKRDLTTIVHAVEWVSDWTDKDSKIKEDLQQLQNQITAAGYGISNIE